MKRDLRNYSQQTSFRFILGGLLLTLIIGNILVFWLYGQQAAIFSLFCMFLALLPVGLIALALWIMGWIANRSRQ